MRSAGRVRLRRGIHRVRDGRGGRGCTQATARCAAQGQGKHHHHHTFHPRQKAHRLRILVHASRCVLCAASTRRMRSAAKKTKKTLSATEVDLSRHFASSFAFVTDLVYRSHFGSRALFCRQGNQLFKEGWYDKAIEAYTEGMESDPYNAILPANRGMALLKQNK